MTLANGEMNEIDAENLDELAFEEAKKHGSFQLKPERSEIHAILITSVLES